MLGASEVPPDTICLTIVLHGGYGLDVQIAVWGKGPGFIRTNPYGNEWGQMTAKQVGLYDQNVYWVAHVPKTTERFVVLCRTDNARYAVEPQDAWQYCQSASLEQGERVKYIWTKFDDLHLFSNYGNIDGHMRRLSDMNEEDVRRLTPAIYIPKRTELHVTPEKK